MQLGIDAREIQYGVYTGIGTVLYTFVEYFSMSIVSSMDRCVLFSSVPLNFPISGNITNIVLKTCNTFYWDQVTLAKAVIKAKIDVFTNIFLLVYLIVLLIGAISSTQYAIEYGQRKFSQWNPSMIPIKLIMTFGIFLMILQTFSTFFKDLAKSRGVSIT